MVNIDLLFTIRYFLNMTHANSKGKLKGQIKEKMTNIYMISVPGSFEEP